MAISQKICAKSGFDHKRFVHHATNYTECDDVMEACVKFSVASIVQAARDLILDPAITHGMTKHQVKKRRQDLNTKADARRWVMAPDTGGISLAVCVDFVNCALTDSDRPEIPLAVIQKTLLNNPQVIVDAFPVGSQGPREDNFDDLDYLLPTGS